MPYKNKSHAERERDSRPRTADDRPSACMRSYDRHWRRTRARHLRDEPLCRECKAAGFIVQASEVDHIIPLGTPGGPGDVPSNRQSLCGLHHRAKTAAERGKGYNGSNNKPGRRGDRGRYVMEGVGHDTKEPARGVGGVKYL